MGNFLSNDIQSNSNHDQIKNEGERISNELNPSTLTISTKITHHSTDVLTQISKSKNTNDTPDVAKSDTEYSSKKINVSPILKNALLDELSIHETRILGRLVSDETFMEDNRFWTELFSLNQSFSSFSRKALVELRCTYCKRLCENTFHTRNFGSLVSLLVICIEEFFKQKTCRIDQSITGPPELKKNLQEILSMMLLDTDCLLNGLVFIREFLILCVQEKLNASQHSYLFQSQKQLGHHMFTRLKNSLLTCLVLYQSSTSTNQVVEQICNVLLLLCYMEKTCPSPLPFKPSSLISAAIHNLVQDDNMSDSDPTFFTILSESVFGNFSSSQNIEPTPGRLIILLLCISIHRDIFVESITSIQENSDGAIQFGSLVKGFRRHASKQVIWILLYHFLYFNPNFSACLREEKEDGMELMLVLLENLYKPSNLSDKSRYLLLIIFLLLTQDPGFNYKIHNEWIYSSVSWYQERCLEKISLGSIIIVVLLRLIQKNITDIKDEYLHVLCFALLINVAESARQIHEYAAQRVVQVLEVLRKKQMLINKNLKEDDINTEEQQAKIIKREAYTDFCVLILHVINSILGPHLAFYNYEMIYAIVQQNHLFKSLTQHANFNTLCEDLVNLGDAFLSGFIKENMDSIHPILLSTDQVLQKIKTACQQIKREQNEEVIFSVSSYAFEEDKTHSSDFFSEFIWEVVWDCTSSLDWKTSTSSKQ